jgi:acetoin utilization deacetylase AcuC-like enzyme
MAAIRALAAPRFVFSPEYVVDLGGHAFATRKFALAADLLRGRGEFVAPPPATREQLLLAHDEAWVEKVLSCRMTLDDEAAMELPFSPALSRAHQLAAGGTILACRDALERGVGLHCGGGSHHAFAGHAEGFCVLNDLAVGILQMRQERRLSRAAVIDLDVHHGNGTASLFAGDPDVFTFSMHQGDIYPAFKPKSSLDIGLKAGTADAEYLALLEENLPSIFAIHPELVVYQAGVDCFERDTLGGLKLTEDGLRRRDTLVRDACRKHGVPVAVTLGGGYAESAETTARLHARTLKVFASQGVL